MREIDRYSYELGIIECFNEMVKAGLKPIALSHPCESRQERDQYIEPAKEICRRYGTRCYAEDVPLLTALFPAAMNAGKYNLVFYRRKEDLERYLGLKEERARLEAEGSYEGGGKERIARAFGELLGYPEDGIRRLMEETAVTEELTGIMERLAGSGQEAAAEWLSGKGDRESILEALCRADRERESGGCDLDPLYKRAIALLGGRQE